MFLFHGPQFLKWVRQASLQIPVAWPRDRFIRGHAALQDEVSQSVSDINEFGPDGDDNQPGDGSGFPIDTFLRLNSGHHFQMQFFSGT